MEEPNALLAFRHEKMEKLRALGVDPFGRAFPGTESSASIRAAFSEGRAVRFAGRILSHRDMGKSHFMHLGDDTGKLQVYIQTKTLAEVSQETFKLIDIGDFIGVEGTLFVTKTGEQSIHVTALHFLTKSLRPLPDKWHGLTDVEQRYRQRYLDLVSNREVKDTLTARARLVRETRNFLEARGFLEVETPMMQAIAGGAAAQPFKTHHNALGIDLYLRIAPELYLKRLLVGGYEKVFELNRNFRNEGISRRHNPEFTMLEAYWAYADYETMAGLVEELICHLAQLLNGKLEVSKRMDGAEEPVTVNLARPWARRTYRDCIRSVAGGDWFELSAQERRERAVSLGVEIIPALEDFEVTNQVFEKLVEAKTVDPLFVTHLPKELVPLAKQNAEDPSVVDVYELIIGGQEISPGYSELNDPVVQRQRLLEQAGAETQKLDEDFLAALEQGMPPAGGLGLGIDRLAMLLTGAESIRDVIFFPLLKPRD
ncbi:MAG: lysine--tRNA ligase [Candidatus Methylacidiphilales bacterium]|nr:lysine--tRNA ligase [Candidatus Methylacidiphilales bacterium]